MNTLAAFGGRRAWIWALPLALVVANLVWLAAFGSGSRLRAADLQRRHQRAESEANRLAARAEARERLWVAAAENERAVEQLVGERLATERERFTEVVREVKQLAERAGLDPQTIGYPRESLEEFGLTRRSFVLPVDGTYSALRTFLNLIELSDTFLVVEEISVAEGRGALSVRLRLATFFQTPLDAARAEEGGS